MPLESLSLKRNVSPLSGKRFGFNAPAQNWSIPLNRIKMKIKCTALAEEMNMEFEQIMERAAHVLQPMHSTGKGKNTWFTEDGADIIRQSEESPLTVAHRYEAFGIKTAPNPRWLYCTIDTFKGKIPVSIPRKMQDRLVGKYFMVEAIKDIKGTTFRHEASSR